MPDQMQAVIDAITQQTMTQIRGPLLRIASCFEMNQENDGDWSWDSTEITDAVYAILNDLGVIKRCGVCQYDFAWARGNGEYYSDEHCPQWDNHICSGGCGQPNDECSCDNCPECGYYDCECPHCDNCEERTQDCECSDAERMWPADA